MKTNVRDFSGESIYVGIDSHLKSWKVTVMSKELMLNSFTQPPDSKQLSAYLKGHYPGADIHCVYEAGFAGFNIQRELSSVGINCMVIHPADVPTSDKEKRRKSDSIDSGKLARGLKNGDFKALHVPTLEQQQDRSLLRIYDRLTRDITRVKNRIKFFLMYFGEAIPVELQASNWSKDFIKFLETFAPGGYGNLSFQALLTEYKMLSQQSAILKKQIKELAEQPRYKTDAELLRTIPGIGNLTSMILLTEIADVNRFVSLKELSAYVGLIPNTHDSGETKKVGRITKRGNVYLKYILVEVSWMCIRYDSSLLLAYKAAVKKMEPNKAIIKVARKLLNRIRFVLKNKRPYQINQGL